MAPAAMHSVVCNVIFVLCNTAYVKANKATLQSQEGEGGRQAERAGVRIKACRAKSSALRQGLVDVCCRGLGWKTQMGARVARASRHAVVCLAVQMGHGVLKCMLAEMM